MVNRADQTTITVLKSSKTSAVPTLIASFSYQRSHTMYLSFDPVSWATEVMLAAESCLTDDEIVAGCEVTYEITGPDTMVNEKKERVINSSLN